VVKQPGANIIETVDLGSGAAAHSGADPGCHTPDTIIDRTETIRASVRDVEFTLLLTIALVVLVVFLFLRNSATSFPRHGAAVLSALLP